MIVEAIATAITSIVGWLVSFLPTGAPWTPNLSAASTFLGSVYAADAYLPITEIFNCMAIALAMLSARQAFTITLFLYRRIRG